MEDDLPFCKFNTVKVIIKESNYFIKSNPLRMSFDTFEYCFVLFICAYRTNPVNVTFLNQILENSAIYIL